MKNESYYLIRKKSEYLTVLEKCKGNFTKTWKKTGVSSEKMMEWLKNDDCFSMAFQSVLDEIEKNNVEK